MRAIIAFAITIFLSFSNSGCQKSSQPDLFSRSGETNAFIPPKGTRLVWSDEFNGPVIDRKNWMFETRETGWNMYWNNEHQLYTDNGPMGTNAFISNGCLVIKAVRVDRFEGFNSYTSARMSTYNLRSWKYGVIAARIRMPRGGNGIWPAFWMLGTDVNENTWPECGEIDIGEMAGGDNGKKVNAGDDVVVGSLHGPEYSGDTAKHSFLPLGGWKQNARLGDDFHVYWVNWKSDGIVWYFDNTPYLKVSSKEVDRWVFNHNFYIILNLAVGGNWPGYPDRNTVFPQYMVVDWVRVYQ